MIRWLRVRAVARALRLDARARWGDGALDQLRAQREAVSERGVIFPIDRIQRIAIAAERRRAFVRHVFGLHKPSTSG